MTVHRRRCNACGRLLYEQGHAKIIEAARTKEGREPAEEFLAGLEKSGKRKDIQRVATTAVLFEIYARTGSLIRPRELNHLRDELWEIKPEDTRLSFYEIEDTLHEVAVVRLTEGFFKTQQLTQNRHIRWGLRVAREDRAA